MSPSSYFVQTAAAETKLKLARDAGDIASVQAAHATIERLADEFYGSAIAPVSCQSGLQQH